MNPDNIYYLSAFLGVGTIVLQIFSVATLFILFFLIRKKQRNKFLDFVHEHFLVLGFFISLCASLFPLVYSEIIKFIPCYLCWWQRIFMFPQAIIFGVALWNKDRKIIDYVAPLLFIGFLISVYQNFFYYFGQNTDMPCDASGISCYQHLVSVFGGYISIPMMALTSFFALLVLVSATHFYRKDIY